MSVQIQDPEQKPVYSEDPHGQRQRNASTTTWFCRHRPRWATTSSKSKPTRAFANANFDVEEYKKPEYEVRVTPAKARVLQGQPMQATIDSRYYFGEPVNGAKVKYAIYRDRY